MQDKYQSFAHSGFGKFLCKNLGLPAPAYLKRYQTSQYLVPNILLVSGQGESQQQLTKVLADSDVTCTSQDEVIDSNKLSSLLAKPSQSKHSATKFDGVVFDARTISQSSQLIHLYQFFNQAVKQVATSGKITILSLDPKTLADKAAATAHFALTGFIKSLAKETGRKGITVNLLQCAPHEEAESCSFASSLRFLQSYRSAYVNAQTVNAHSVNAHDVNLQNTYLESSDTQNRNVEEAKSQHRDKPLAGKVALVTGAARGIGAEIAKTLAREGAQIIGLDIAPTKAQLAQTMAEVNGKSILLDISAQDAAQSLATQLKELGLSEQNNALDIVVHNAGITRDKMLSRMSEAQWQQVLQINLTSIERVNQYLLDNQLINEHGRIIGVSSISGIAGNVGQTNYATSKAGVWGMVNFQDQQMLARGITFNAVAPGFIETEMTAKIPWLTRQFGRRFCSLSQAGLPVDVAETITYFALPQSYAVNGNLVRVCGQNLLGA